MRYVILFMTILSLTACGGRSSSTGSGGRAASTYSTGPIAQACLAADRDAANRQICGCVQAVANRTLSDRDRARVVRFFGDPEIAHETKISDTAANDAFWRRYRDFVSASRQACG